MTEHNNSDEALKLAIPALVERLSGLPHALSQRVLRFLEDPIGAKRAQVNDIIQLDPERCEWGPLLCIVEETSSTGVLCYAIHPEERGKVRSRMYLRPRHGEYIVVGCAEWLVAGSMHRD